MGLVVQTSAPAAALIDGGELVKGALKGAKIGGPVSIFGKWAGPIGWTLTAAAIGYGVWSTRDSWMGATAPEKDLDWWADQDPNWTAPVGVSPEGWGPYGVDTRRSFQITSVSGRSMSWEAKCVGMSGSFNCTNSQYGIRLYQNGAQYECRKTDLSTYITAGTASFSVLVGGSNGLTRTGVFDICAAGETLLGVKVPPQSSYQSFGLAWGTFIPPTNVWPTGDVSFGTMRVDTTCKNDATGAIEHIITTTPQEPGSYGFVLPSCSARLGPGWHASGITIAPEAPEIDNEPIPDEIEVPDFLPAEWDEMIPDDEPDWQPGKELTVWIDGEKCDFDVPICKTWTKVLTKEADRVVCKYGSRVVDVKYCFPLQYYYDLDVQTNVDTGTGTETPIDTSVPDPTAPPTTETPVDTSPNGPVPDPEAEAAKSACFPKGWSAFNPMEWVYKPVKCVLVWAFVPDGDFGLDTLVETVRTRPPGSLVLGVGQAAQSALSGFTGGGCGTLGVIPLPGPDLSLSCPEITGMSGYGLVYSGFEALIYGSGIFAVFRMITGAFRKGSDT
jgi:hypothetical protein